MKYLLVILFLFGGMGLFAQSSAINEYSSVKYDHTYTIGLTLHTHGWGINTQYLIDRSHSRNLAFNLDILTLKHPKETKVVNSIYSDAKPYVYGKINSVLNIRSGLGNQFIIADKENPLSIRINLNYSLGMDLTLLKPEYLKILYPIDNIYSNIVVERYDPDNPHHAAQNNIHGRAGFSEGLDELTGALGAYCKLSLSFEWDEYQENFKYLETGLMIDAYPEALPIFGFIENKSVFTNLFLNIGLGKKW